MGVNRHDDRVRLQLEGVLPAGEILQAAQSALGLGRGDAQGGAVTRNMGEEGDIDLVLGQGAGDLGAQAKFSPGRGRHQTGAGFDDFQPPHSGLRTVVRCAHKQCSCGLSEGGPWLWLKNPFPGQEEFCSPPEKGWHS